MAGRSISIFSGVDGATLATSSLIPSALTDLGLNHQITFVAEADHDVTTADPLQIDVFGTVGPDGLANSNYYRIGTFDENDTWTFGSNGRYYSTLTLDIWPYVFASVIPVTSSTHDIYLWLVL